MAQILPARCNPETKYLGAIYDQLVLGEVTTIADGADVALGTKADVASTDNTSSSTVISLLKGVLGNLLPKSTSNTPSIQSGATALVANTNRKSATIQNLGTNSLYVLFGSGASTTSFHVVLKAGTINDDGLGGSVYNDEYTGIITIAGTSPRYTSLEL